MKWDMHINVKGIRMLIEKKQNEFGREKRLKISPEVYCLNPCLRPFSSSLPRYVANRKPRQDRPMDKKIVIWGNLHQRGQGDGAAWSQSHPVQREAHWRSPRGAILRG